MPTFLSYVVGITEIASHLFNFYRHMSLVDHFQGYLSCVGWLFGVDDLTWIKHIGEGTGKGGQASWLMDFLAQQPTLGALETIAIRLAAFVIMLVGIGPRKSPKNFSPKLGPSGHLVRPPVWGHACSA